MPVIFRPARPSRRVTGGTKGYVPTISPIRSTVGAAAGAATVTGVGVAIIAAIGLTDGSASVNGVGVALKSAAGTAAGTATAAAPGVQLNTAVGLAAGAATVSGVYDSRAITSTRVIQKPVDYALAGQQGRSKGRIGGRALRHAFGE